MTRKPRMPRASRDTDRIPDVRDGLTRVERAILAVLAQTEKELGRAVPTAMLYGRVLELVDISQREFQETLTRLVGQRVK